MSLIQELFGNTYVTGDTNVDKPEMRAYNNCISALEMLNKHINLKSKIIIHCDVDCDGIGSGYIMRKMLKDNGVPDGNIGCIINKEKVHGISEKAVTVFNNVGAGLIIIVDSSSNDIDLIKKIGPDVLVIDHHEMLHSDTQGYKTINGVNSEYVIVNNMLGGCNPSDVNEWVQMKNPGVRCGIVEHTSDSKYSAGLLCYELLRIYYLAFRREIDLEYTKLYQWASITLFTDVVSCNNKRNFWYIDTAINDSVLEENFGKMMKKLDTFNKIPRFTKTGILYKLAPTINKLIRCGHSGKALEFVTVAPERIKELSEEAKEKQDSATMQASKYIVETEKAVYCDITNTDISSNYTGVLASKMSGDTAKCSLVYKLVDGLYIGSFRGNTYGVDFRATLEEFGQGKIYAQGHKGAFGFKIPVDMMDNVKEFIETMEIKPNKDKFIAIGANMRDRGYKYYVDDVTQFKRDKELFRLSYANSRVSSEEQVMIEASSYDVMLIGERGKLLLYDVAGIECKAFRKILTQSVKVYAEGTFGGIEMYIKD